MTIYRLYSENGNRAGFWVQHRSWRNICAQVQSIDGHRTGALPGSPALYDNTKVSMRVFDVRSGRPLVPGSSGDPPDDRNYARIAEPYWYEAAAEAPAQASGSEASP